MPDRRDPVEKGIDAIGGALIGGIVSFGMGLARGQQIAKAQEKTIGFADTLEVDHDHTYIVSKPGTKASVDAFRAVFGTFLAIVGVLAACANPIVNPRSGLGGLDILFCAVPWSLFWGLVALQNWNKYNGETPNHPDFKIKPLDLSQARVYTITLPRTAEWQTQTAGRFMQDILQKLGFLLTLRAQGEYKTRRRNKSSLARPYICRLSSLSR